MEAEGGIGVDDEGGWGRFGALVTIPAIPFALAVVPVGFGGRVDVSGPRCGRDVERLAEVSMDKGRAELPLPPPPPLPRDTDSADGGGTLLERPRPP